MFQAVLKVFALSQLSGTRWAILGVVMLFAPAAAWAWPPASDVRPTPLGRVSFLNDVEPLLTRLGCNRGACHGKGVGQNGFRLSLRGYAPELDHFWITREFAARRIDRLQPERSLFLRKPLGEIPHGGGRIFLADSREHRLLLDWLNQGTDGPSSSDPRILELRIDARGGNCVPDETRPLRVLATYDDGQVRDVTWLAKFASNDEGLMQVDAAGVVTVLRHGETSIRAHFQGMVATLVLSSPFEHPVQRDQFPTPRNVLDELVFQKLCELRIPPSPDSSDATWARRVFLDTIGTLPTPQEARAFLHDVNPEKRAKLVDALFSRPEFVDFWALQLSDLFQNRRERDHDVRGAKGVRSFHRWLQAQLRQNRPWDELVRDVLVARGDAVRHPEIGFYIVTVGEAGQADQSEVASSVAQSLLGTRIGCARCHNHPLERYTQDDYFHFAGFFSTLKFQRRESHLGPTELLLADWDPSRPVGATQPRTGRVLAPRPLDRKYLELLPGQDPREPLARWLTSAENKDFSGAMVNRLVKHFLGVGLVEPVDDLRASNPPSNARLWDALCEELTSHEFDLKHLMRLIVTSRTYQFSSEALPENAADARFYSHYYPRRLQAEVLLDAVSDATSVAENLPGQPRGLHARQVADSGLDSYFLSLFGRSPRVTACACERQSDVTLPQLLHLQNGDAIVNRISQPGGVVESLLANSPNRRDMIEDLFWRTLCRAPSAAEWPELEKLLAELESPANESPAEILGDLFWSLLNTKEFSFNH